MEINLNEELDALAEILVQENFINPTKHDRALAKNILLRGSIHILGMFKLQSRSSEVSSRLIHAAMLVLVDWHSGQIKGPDDTMMRLAELDDATNEARTSQEEDHEV